MIVIFSTIDQTIEELGSSRRLDQPSESLIDAVEHLIEVENSTEDDDGRFSLDDLNSAWTETNVALKQAKRSLHWSDDRLKEVIASRIREEFDKHGNEENIDWIAIVAEKIVENTS